MTEYTSKAVITWADSEWEYELEIKNEDMDEDFEAWVEKNAEELAKEDATEKNTTFDEVLGIKYEYDWIDDESVAYERWVEWAEFQWECEMGK